ncbi:MAG: nucleotidyltransferase domain-containing protein [Candidatus Pacearchaeota archaeon]|jgi:predicted nucleotidyltransferase
MYDNTTLKILKEIYTSPGIHKRGLSRKLKLTMPSVTNSINKIKKIIKEEKSGNQIKYYLDFSKDLLTPMLYLVEYNRFMELPSNIKISIKDFLNELDEKPILAFIFGSLARGDYTKDSDIDIFLVYQKTKGIDIENKANQISMRTNTKISPVYLDYDSFKESFCNQSKDFFKNIRKNKLLLIGIEYWRLLENANS